MCMIQSASGTNIVKLTLNKQIKYSPAQWVPCKKPDGENRCQSVRWSEALEQSWGSEEQDSGCASGLQWGLPQATDSSGCQPDFFGIK